MKQLIDERIILVKSGRGGSGCESYWRRSDRKLVPNGGDGGSGGDVVIRATDEVGSLTVLKPKHLYEAETGGAGSGNNRYGKNAPALVLKVPRGTSIFDRDRQLLLRDLVSNGDQVVVAKGGRGGYGNHAGRPRRMGEEGESREIYLSLAILADIVLVGFPNSGKTTLLRHLTGAHVEPTEFPFATKWPALGTYETTSAEYRLCELPSLYVHSAEGRGLGVSFLKHLKWARLVVFVLDPRNAFAKSIQEEYDILFHELEKFDPLFTWKPRIVAVNKTDLLNSKELAQIKKIKFADPVFYISAKEAKGIGPLMKKAVLFVDHKAGTHEKEF